MIDEEIIQRTFTLARKALGLTWPNPMVGAVIVKDGKIIGEGFHRKKGDDHAEIDAIKNASEPVRGATIYINLEPCCHSNKSTPPCAQRLIQEGFKRVVFSNLDPNPEVNGRAVELLRSHGVEVDFGILEGDGEKLNEVFFLSQRQQRPFIHFKSAVSLDGKIALSNGESQWITGQEARAHVQFLRSTHQAILIGGETLRKDNPRLTVRLPLFTGPQPYRVVVTRSADFNSDFHLFNDEFLDRTLIYSEKPLSFDFPTHQVMQIKSLRDVLDDLFKKNIINVLMEAGPQLASAFLKDGLIDRVTLYQNPSLIGVGKNLFSELSIQTLNNRPKLSNLESKWIGNDHYLTGRL